jgi:uncharacterized cupin superfamily protein
LGVPQAPGGHMTRSNVFAREYEYDGDAPDGYRCGEAPDVRAIGMALTVRSYELPPGQSICPYHYEYEEEWLLVLEGAARLRTPEGDESLERGDLVRFPPGPEGAHKVTALADGPARVLMFSTAREPAVAVYPDSDKIGVWPGRREDNVMLHRNDGKVDYWEGER